MTYMNIGRDAGISCPYAFPASNDIHRLYNRMLDLMYRDLPKNDEDEIDEESPASKLYYNLQNKLDYHMRLYRGEAGFIINAPKTRVDTWWWMCPICEFVLPATGAVSR